MEKDYHTQRNFVFVSSRDRDVTVYPSPGNFKITLPQDGYTNVVSVELVAGTVPNQDGVTADPYLLLDIDGLNHIRASNGCEYFSILSIHKGHSDSFFNMDRSSSAMMPHQHYSVKQRLTSIHVKLTHPDGTPVDFGTDLLPLNQTDFTFEVKTRENDRKGFDKDFRKVF